MAVVSADGETESVVLAETPFTEWCEYTRGERSWDIGSQVAGSLVGGFARGGSISYTAEERRIQSAEWESGTKYRPSRYS
ncbi:hypothetical protein Har1131_21075 [Haloarcula sp. CBA1131]|nr:hypothetical protein Har1131_21075 [Haloarcula sp. CBA1131]